MRTRALTASTIWHSVRCRPLFRNLLYGGLSLLLFYLVYLTVTPRGLMSMTFSLEETYLEPSDVSPLEWNDRAVKVKRAFQHAYHGYERYAAPSDELKPLSMGMKNNFNGWGVSAFDSLDTMLLMELRDEYERALPIVKQANFSISENTFVPYFETIIRYLGGLLSAYALSNDTMLLARADELATRLDPIFQTKSGLPLYEINPTTGETRGPVVGILAEMASLQLEYAYLAKLTGKEQHFKRADAVMRTLSTADLEDTGGMLPIGWNLTSGQPFDSRLSVGAQADSAHEYLLKYYLMTAKTDKKNLEMYIHATNRILSTLLYVSPTRNLLYVTDTRFDKPTHVFEHLSCFLPGLLALGVHTLPLDDIESLGVDVNKQRLFGGTGYKILSGYDLKQLHLWAAEGLAQTCWLTYADQSSGLGPDEVMFNAKVTGGSYLWVNVLEKWKSSGGRGSPPGVGDTKPVRCTEKEKTERVGCSRRRDYAALKPAYLLRPETIESLYILWRVTGDWKWRVRGWSIFEAIEKGTKTAIGFASVRSVEDAPPVKDDDMPSYFLAETLKYLYLMFIDKDPVPLNDWVFNTEAHPFPVFQWTMNEMEHFSIRT